MMLVVSVFYEHLIDGPGRLNCMRAAVALHKDINHCARRIPLDWRLVKFNFVYHDYSTIGDTELNWWVLKLECDIVGFTYWKDGNFVLCGVFSSCIVLYYSLKLCDSRNILHAQKNLIQSVNAGTKNYAEISGLLP
ncbi:hypothetical protein CY34DRAFT_648191 [Suillus luteus UH-Slu-Lm8-n1]|uniref:Uncharacterized protein n=1 Tax=Suillus luteus UH-Slu-Lm8-n1 TaxID=930992 RepID=A0A0D0BLQ4_9AGAM|nr:hypothetical protein CY34DRAFT_648191 [Suillus luteus UH-Slu-Lm8-n1]